MAVRLELAGRVCISRGADHVGEEALGRQGRLALAYLVCERRRPVPRDELAEVVWGEDLPESWEQMLRGIIARIRTCLRSVGVDSKQALTTTLGGYQFHLAAEWVVDVEMAAEAAQAAFAATDPDSAAALASSAIEVASGQFLPGASGLWVELRQAELRELHVRGLEALARAETARSCWSAAVTAAEEAIAMEPLRESAYRELMAAHALGGNRGEALRAYERCRRTLVDELGVHPSAATEADYFALIGDETGPITEAPDLEPGVTDPPLPPALSAAPGSFLVGRERELARLTDTLARAAAGGRHAIVVAGEPGIGKTTLVSALARTAHSQGWRVLYGRCDEEPGLAYRPFAEAIGHYVAHCPISELKANVATHGSELARLAPELLRRLPDTPAPLPTDPEVDRFRMFEAATSLLEASSQVAPVLIFLDDLHWAASVTLSLLRHLLRSARPANLMIVGTYRDTEVGHDHPLATTLADLRRDPVPFERVVLEGLDSEGVAAFVRAVDGHEADVDRAGLADALQAHTAGNPFFVTELLRHLAETGGAYRRSGQWSAYQASQAIGVPHGVRDVVARRLGRLGRAANQVLVTASVIGTEFHLDLLELVLEHAEGFDLLDAVEEAERCHVLVEVGHGHYRFSHVLVRDTIYGGLTATRRIRLHRRVGLALESMSTGDDGRLAPALAHHFAEAAPTGCGLKAADYALTAARQAIAQAAWEEAIARLQVGLSAIDDMDPPDLDRRLDLLLLLAETWTRFFNPQEVLSTAGAAVEVARAVRSPERLGRAAYWYLRAASGTTTSDYAEVMELADQAVVALDEELPALRSKILAIAARLQDTHGQSSEATSRQALALARESGDLDALGVALLTTVGFVGSLRPPERLVLADELVRAAPVDGWDGWRDGHSQRAICRLALGDRTGFEEDVAACEQLGVQRRFWYFRWIGALWRGTLALLDGRFDEVEALAEHARAITLQEPYRLLTSVQLFRLRFEQGDLVRAHSVAIRAVEDWSDNTLLRTMVTVVLAASGDVDEARREYKRFADDCIAQLPWQLRPVAMAYRAEVVTALSDTAGARALYEELRAYSGQLAISGIASTCLGAVDRYLGMLAATEQRWVVAEGHYRDAETLEVGLTSPPISARTKYWYGRMLLERGEREDIEDGRRLLTTAVHTAESLGMGALSAEGRRLLGEV